MLPCDKDVETRAIVRHVNKVLRQKICKLHDFYFMEEDFDWINDDDSLNMEVYYQDRIHLNHNGNEKFGNTIIRKFKEIESLSPSSSAGIILRMPSVEAPQNAARRVSPVLSTVSSPPVSSPPMSSPRMSSPRSLFTEVPKSVYYHRKQLLKLSTQRPLYHFSLRSRQRRSSHCRSPPSSHPSPSVSSPPVSSPPVSSPPVSSPPVSSPPVSSPPVSSPPVSSPPVSSPPVSSPPVSSPPVSSPPVSSPSYSFLSFLMMVLSSISLPVTTFSSHFASFLWHSRSRSSRCIPSLSSSLRSPHSHSFKLPLHSNKFISMLFLFIFTYYFLCLLSRTSMTADLTDCESPLSNNSLSFNCSNQFSLIYRNNSCVFLPDRYSFLRTTSYPENTTIVVFFSLLWEIEDTGQPISTFLILKVSICLVFFCFKIFLRYIGINCSTVNYKDNRFFIRKRLKLRKCQKMCSVGHIFLFTHLLIKEEEKCMISSHDRDFFTVEFIRFIKLDWESNLSFYSISFLLTKRSYFKNTQDYLWILVVLA